MIAVVCPYFTWQECFCICASPAFFGSLYSTAMSIEVVIFSFNRGRLLRNCVMSVRELMPDVPITVFDDRSTDKETSAILEGFNREGLAKILTPQASRDTREGCTPHGGLYENIQSFLDVHARSSLALFLQDDTQIVRRFTQHDRWMLDRIFSDYPQAAFIYPAFLTHDRYYSEFVDLASLATVALSFSFLYDYEYSGYFDICVAHISRLRNTCWQFGDELQTSLSARKRFGPMRLMRQPFVAHLPSPPTYRNRGQTLTQRAWEWFRAGLYPVDSLSDSNLQRLSLMKDPFPTAGSFLTSKSFWGSHPWPIGKLDGASGLIRFLDRVECRLRRGFTRRLH